jgi:hypothetical protein
MWKKIVYLTIALLLTSCTYKLDCPGYPKKYLVWMPYILDEKISFTDGIDTIQLRVEEAYLREPYIMKRFKSVKGGECASYAYCSITGDSLPRISFNSDGYDYEADFKIGFQFISGAEYFGFRHNNGESILTYEPYQHIEIFNSYDNGCKVFKDVIMMESDTLAIDVRIYQICLAKNAGIIQFKDRLAHKTWSLIQ